MFDFLVEPVTLMAIQFLKLVGVPLIVSLGIAIIVKSLSSSSELAKMSGLVSYIGVFYLKLQNIS